MGKIRQINIKDRTYDFYNDQINLKYFDANLLKIDKKDFDERLLKVDKKDYNEIDIYYIGYVTIEKIDNCNSNSFVLNDWWNDGHFEEKNKNKYLVLDDVDEKRKFQKNIIKFGKVLKKKLKRLMVAKKFNMRKVTWKLSINLMMICHLINLIKLRLLTTIVKCVNSEDGKFYPQ